MPRVLIGQRGRAIDLGPQDVLGDGGEGVVYGIQDKAIKIYHNPPDQKRTRKLQDLQSLIFPHEVVGPLELAWDLSGNRIIGFVMRRLTAGQQPFETLMKRGYRDDCGITTKDVVDIYLKLYGVLCTLHKMGVVIGDFNGLNELYKKIKIALIDADSFQFGSYPCVVATERFLTPRLYGVKDFAAKPYFEIDDDWYSYLVMLFYSLLLVHPYGGSHRKLKTFPKRALARITAFDASVIYPKDNAYPPEILSDELTHLFVETFANGNYRAPDIHLLENYRSILIGCPVCGLWYPHNRKSCPGCDALNQQAQVMKVQVVGVSVTEMINTQGPIIFFKLIGSTMYAIAVEGDKAVLYIKKSMETLRKMPLFKATREARYDIFDKYLVVCPEPYAEKPEIYILNVSGGKAEPVTKTVTDRFADRGAVFRGTANYFYRVIGGILLRGKISFGNVLVEDVIDTVMERQAWFDAAPDTGQELLFGFYRVFRKYEWFLIHDGKSSPVAIPDLERDEAMVDRSIRFSQSTILLLRKTRKRGEEFCRIDLVDIAYNAIISSRRVSLSDNLQFSDIHTAAYARGTILIPTQDGLLAEEAETGEQKVFPAATNFVNAGSRLWPYENGILAIFANKVIKLVLSK